VPECLRACAKACFLDAFLRGDVTAFNRASVLAWLLAGVLACRFACEQSCMSVCVVDCRRAFGSGVLACRRTRVWVYLRALDFPYRRASFQAFLLAGVLACWSTCLLV
jgi:hypothetical protein